MYQSKFGRNSQSPSQPASPAPQQPKKKARLQPRLGTTIFYTLYVLFVLLFCGAVYLGLGQLNTWLMEFENAQPQGKADTVFQQYFQDPQWEQLYASAGLQDSLYEDAGDYAAYMEEQAETQSLTWQPVSSPAPDSRQYSILLGSQEIGRFQLTDHSRASGPLPDIPDWRLSHMELYLKRDLRLRFQVPEGCTVQINGVALGEDHVVQISAPLAAECLPQDAPVVRRQILEVNGLLCMPEVTVQDPSGNAVDVTYDASAQTYTAASLLSSLPSELESTVLDAAQYHTLWLAGQVSDTEILKTHFAEDTPVYQTLADTASGQHSITGEITRAVISGYNTYGDRYFSVHVDMEVKLPSSILSYSKSLIFRKEANGTWLCIYAADQDLSQESGRVRLTFMVADTPIYSDFFHTDAREVITPIFSAPNGSFFAGWFRHMDDGSQELVFPPESTGHSPLAEGQVLTPMTLYAHFAEAN